LHEKDVFENMGDKKCWFVAGLLRLVANSAGLRQPQSQNIDANYLGSAVWLSFCQSNSPKNKIPITGSNIN
jgi:hypothetical protein